LNLTKKAPVLKEEPQKFLGIRKQVSGKYFKRW
jgi:hypothetical protein